MSYNPYQNSLPPGYHNMPSFPPYQWQSPQASGTPSQAQPPLPDYDAFAEAIAKRVADATAESMSTVREKQEQLHEEVRDIKRALERDNEEQIHQHQALLDRLEDLEKVVCGPDLVRQTTSKKRKRGSDNAPTDDERTGEPSLMSRIERIELATGEILAKVSEASNARNSRRHSEMRAAVNGSTVDLSGPSSPLTRSRSRDSRDNMRAVPSKMAAPLPTPSAPPSSAESTKSKFPAPPRLNIKTSSTSNAEPSTAAYTKSSSVAPKVLPRPPRPNQFKSALTHDAPSVESGPQDELSPSTLQAASKLRIRLPQRPEQSGPQASAAPQSTSVAPQPESIVINDDDNDSIEELYADQTEVTNDIQVNSVVGVEAHFPIPPGLMSVSALKPVHWSKENSHTSRSASASASASDKEELPIGQPSSSLDAYRLLPFVRRDASPDGTVGSLRHTANVLGHFFELRDGPSANLPTPGSSQNMAAIDEAAAARSLPSPPETNAYLSTSPEAADLVAGPGEGRLSAELAPSGTSRPGEHCVKIEKRVCVDSDMPVDEQSFVKDEGGPRRAPVYSFRDSLSPLSVLSDSESEDDGKCEGRIRNGGAAASARLAKKRRLDYTCKSHPSSKTSKPKPRWPMKSPGDDDIYQQLLGCDNCKNWYHMGCSGTKEDDPRLDDGADWLCPDCEALDPNKRRPAMQEGLAFCQRPGKCFYRSYPPERFVARMLNTDPQFRSHFLWLVKWHDWDLDNTTWQDEACFDGNTFSSLREAFYEAAEIDQVDVADETTVISLKEAASLKQLQPEYLPCPVRQTLA